MTASSARLPIVLALGCLTACADTAGVKWETVTLRTDLQSYAPGDSMVVTLTNPSEGEVRYSWCTLGVQRRIGEEWEHAGGATLEDFVETGRVGYAERWTFDPGCDLVPLAEGTTATETVPVQPSSWAVEPGAQYRLMIGLVGDRFEDRAVTISNVFDVAQ